jgi:hypothetical protein
MGLKELLNKPVSKQIVIDYAKQYAVNFLFLFLIVFSVDFGPTLMQEIQNSGIDFNNIQEGAEVPAIIALVSATFRAIGRAIFTSGAKVAKEGVGSVLAK